MPTYEYVCKRCGHLFEIVQSMKDEALTECPECGGELRKVFAAPAISFKGSGFYATDHGKKSKKPSESKPSESKPGTGKKEPATSASGGSGGPSSSGGSGDSGGSSGGGSGDSGGSSGAAAKEGSS